MPVVVGCIGFGSLIWQPALRPGGPLEAQGVRGGTVEDGGSWHPDGPTLPLELARHSTQDGQPYLAWVLVPGAAESPALWATLRLPAHAADDLDLSLLLASRALADREEAATHDIGRWPALADDPPRPESAAIDAWLRDQPLDGVVWTALPPRWQGTPQPPATDAALAWLRELEARGEAGHAREYVRNTPAQITSPLRRALTRDLGW